MPAVGRVLTYMAQALVALKDLAQAKTRLAGLLRPSERRALALAMLEDVLTVLQSHPQIDCITLISDDPAAHLLAGRYALQHWREGELDGVGLNALIGSASARLRQAGTESLVVLHADLPLLAEGDISAVLLAQRESAGLVLACDRHGSGTNLLAFSADSMPPFCFGPGSCAAHIAAASSMGIDTRVIRRTGLALDVDEPQDLDQLLAALPRAGRTHTASLLSGTALGKRIDLALASLSTTTPTFEQQGAS